jgi:predicted phage tail protein
MQQTVRLLGDLGERYGSEHKYHELRSPAEAIKLLCINHPEFAKELAEAHEHGIGYTVVQADEFLDYSDLHLPLGKNDLVLTPVVAGSGGGGGGIGKILLGVGLIAAAIVFAPAGAGFLGLGAGVGGFTGAFAANLSIAVGAIGTSLLLSGVSQMIAPQPVIPTLGMSGNRTSPGENTNATGPQGVSRATAGEQSYAFAGPANTVGVGATVPIVYGQILIGSHLLSSKVVITDDSDPVGDYFSDTGASSVLINGENPGYNFEALGGLRSRRWSTSQVGYKTLTGTNGFKKKIFNEDKSFQSKSVDEFKEIKEYNDDDDESENLQILLEIDKGLGRHIGNQLVPAFVTYEFTVKKHSYNGKSPIFAKVSATIQGLLKPDQDYKFAHAISYGHSGTEENETKIDLKFRIIDSDADIKGGRIVVRGVGYNWFNDKDENETQNLVTEI